MNRKRHKVKNIFQKHFFILMTLFNGMKKYESCQLCDYLEFI